MVLGVQINDTLLPNQTVRYFTFGWDPAWDVLWTVVPTTPAPGNPEITWDVFTERASATAVTYWVQVQNLTSGPVTIEGRYAILNL